MSVHFVLGGARSGKSRFAEKLVEETGLQKIYVATAQALDPEMQTRIDKHQSMRDMRWQLVEAPFSMAAVLNNNQSSRASILVDCLTLWLSNHLANNKFDDWAVILKHFEKALEPYLGSSERHVVLVSNEVGQGIVPLGELSRRFVDESGFMHQRLSEICDKVYFVVAGLAQRLK